MLLSGWFAKLSQRRDKGIWRRTRSIQNHLSAGTAAECLEVRALLSNVAVSLSSAGALTLTGDSGDDTVAAAVVNGQLELTGSNGTTLTFNGTTATTVDVPLSGGISSIAINMQGTGNNSVTFDASGMPGISGNVTASFGGGADTFVFENASVGGKISVSAGDGADAITLSGDTVTKSISVTAGGGADTLTAANDTAAGLVIAVGDGNDTIAATGDTITGKLDVHAGIGTDSVTLTSDSAGGVVIHVGGGNDTISLSSVTLTGTTSSTTASVDQNEGVPGHPLAIVAGNGSDTIILTSVTSAGAAQGGHWTVAAGSGSDTVTISQVTDNGFLSVSAKGTGNDTVAISDSTFTKNVVVSLPNGTEQITLTGDTFGSPVTLSTGTGTGSTITVSGSDFAKLVKVSMAGPSATLNVETGTVAGTQTEFHGPVQVTFGASGTVNLGVNAVGDTVKFDKALTVTGSTSSPATVNVQQSNVTLKGTMNLISAVAVSI